MWRDPEKRQRPERPEQSKKHTNICMYTLFFTHTCALMTFVTYTNARIHSLWLNLNVLTPLGADTKWKRVWGETNKFREKKLALLLHCPTPLQTPQFSHYTPLQHPSTDKRVPPAGVIGNQVSTLLCSVPYQSHRPERMAEVGQAQTKQTHTQQRQESIGRSQGFVVSFQFIRLEQNTGTVKGEAIRI